MKTPCRTIRGFVNLLANDADDMVYYAHMKTTTYFRMSIAALTFAAAQTQADITTWMMLQEALSAETNAYETITLTQNITAPRAGLRPLVISQEITLDLNGHTLTGNGRSEVFQVDEDGLLTLTDGSASGTGLVTGGKDSIVYVAEYGTFEMYGGAIAGTVPTGDNSGGGGVYVDGGGSFEMYGGAITNNTAAYGGGVYVYCNGYFDMHDGLISGNTANFAGGGVYIARAETEMDSGGSFSMYGGTITGNFAETGGGVLVERGSVEDDYGSDEEEYVYTIEYAHGEFSMSGGIITGNGALGNGGGVYVANEDSLYVSDAPVIAGNTNILNGTNNVYLDTSYGIYVGTLSAGASIGVTSFTAPGEDSPVAFSYSLESAGDGVYFFSDNPNYSVELVGGELCLVYGSAYPAYLTGADDVVKSNYVAWAALYGADTAGEYEEEFLLNIAPATTIPPAASLLRIVSFAPTAAGWRMGIASDVTALTAINGTARVGNGYLSVLRATDLMSPSNGWSTSTIPVSVVSGLITVDVPTGATPPSRPFFKVKLSVTP